jgi:hypothetical protein
MGERKKIKERRDVRVTLVALIPDYGAAPRLEPASDGNGLAVARRRRHPYDAAIGVAFKQRESAFARIDVG